MLRKTRPFIFLLILALLFSGVSALMQPLMTDSYDYNSRYGFYDEPDDTIEVLFLGASTVYYGVSPMELYEDYGICAYDLATASQSIELSYYLLREALRLHGDSLKTVVLEISRIRADDSDNDEMLRRAMDVMPLTRVKLGSVLEHTGSLKDALSYLFPIFIYHQRWKELEKLDFIKSSYRPDSFLRGCHPDKGLYIEQNTLEEAVTPAYWAQEGDITIADSSMVYLEKIMDFCEEEGLNLVLMRLPQTYYWNKSYHDMFEELSKNRGTGFLDLNMDPAYSDMAYNFAADNQDYAHANYYGMRKISSAIGTYLSAGGLASDVRGRERYAFMEEQLSDYKRIVGGTAVLWETEDPADYISAAAVMEDAEIFISVKGDAASALTEEQRSAFADMGLSGLSSIGFGHSYIGIMDSGSVIYEAVSAEEPTRKKGLINGSIIYTLSGGGYGAGNTSSCVIDGEEMSPGSAGINVIVYDRAREKLIDSCSFDTTNGIRTVSRDIETALSAELSSGTQIEELPELLWKLYMYNEKCARDQ